MSKWFVAGGKCENTVVSNGFKQLRLKPGCAEYRIDIVAGLVSETYRIQARALCTGSDGLAELGEQDILDIVLPRVSNGDARAAIEEIVDALLAGRATVSGLVGGLREDGHVHPDPSRVRGTNWVQV